MVTSTAGEKVCIISQNPQFIIRDNGKIYNMFSFISHSKLLIGGIKISFFSY